MKPTLQEIGDLLKKETAGSDKHYYGQIQSQITSGDGTVTGYRVSLGGSSDTVICRKLAGAKVGDTVMVTLLSSGVAVVTGTLGGDTDAIDALDKAAAIEADYVKATLLEADVARIGFLKADSATIRNLEADTAKIHDLTADQIRADHAAIGALDANYANIDAANITDLSAKNAWVNQLMVQTGLLAHEGTVFTLDAIQVNAANITAGTLDVNRLIVTVGEGSSAQKYLVNINPTTGTPSYEKLDGNIVGPRTITADKIVAHDITVQEITTENLVGTNGWINLNLGRFFYGNGSTWASATTGIMWDGTSLKIKGEVNVTGGNVYTQTQANNAIKNAIDDIEIGGTNLVPDSKLMGKWTLGTNASKHTIGYDLNKIQIKMTGTTANWSGYFETKETRPIDDFDGGEYTLSFEYNSSAEALFSVNLNGNSVNPYSEALARTKYCSLYPQTTFPSTSGKWVKKSVTFSFNSYFTGTRANGDAIPINGSGDVSSWTLAFYNRTDDVNVYVRHVKLEKGNKATAWSPNPDDGYSGGGDNLLKGSDLLANGSSGYEYDKQGESNV